MSFFLSENVSRCLIMKLKPSGRRLVSRKGCSQVLYGGCKLMEPKQDFLFFPFFFFPYGVILCLSACQGRGGELCFDSFCFGSSGCVHATSIVRTALKSLSCSEITRTPVRARQQQVRFASRHLLFSHISGFLIFFSSSMKKRRDSIWCVFLKKLFPGNVSSGIYIYRGET